MFPSGVWRGFWVQEWHGRQEMEAFELHFRDGEVTGHGRDIVGRFVFQGEYDEKTGHVRMVKQYLGKHQVFYDGRPDGEGSILGKWTIRLDLPDGKVWESTGPFRLHPDVPRPTGDEPIYEIRK
jgi:hypothetical protein